MSSSVMNSQSVILTTAMAVSGAVIFLSLSRIRNSTSHPPNHLPASSLRSCLSSDDKKGEKKKKIKKRVKFADNVKDKKSDFTTNIITPINEKKKKKVEIFEDDKKIPEFRRMPANRAALYHGILKDRVHRVECSY